MVVATASLTVLFMMAGVLGLDTYITPSNPLPGTVVKFTESTLLDAVFLQGAETVCSSAECKVSVAVTSRYLLVNFSTESLSHLVDVFKTTFEFHTSVSNASFSTVWSTTSLLIRS